MIMVCMPSSEDRRPGADHFEVTKAGGYSNLIHEPELLPRCQRLDRGTWNIPFAAGGSV